MRIGGFVPALIRAPFHPRISLLAGLLVLAFGAAPATAATFGYVARVALDGDTLLVVDQSNARVRGVMLR